MRSAILARVFSGEGMINFLSSQSPLELLREASLLQNSISRVARFDFTIYGETTVCHVYRGWDVGSKTTYCVCLVCSVCFVGLVYFVYSVYFIDLVYPIVCGTLLNSSTFLLFSLSRNHLILKRERFYFPTCSGGHSACVFC